MNTLPVLEIFGPTIQGEGALAGLKTIFIRTAGCDYRCSWCDSAFTWDGSAKHDIVHYTPKQLLEEIVTRIPSIHTTKHITLSGGNPGLLRDSASDFIDLLHEHDISISMETQGSIWREWFVKLHHITISPKPPSSNMATNWEQLHFVLNRLQQSNVQITLKVVVFNEQDYEFAKEVKKRYPSIPFYLSVGNSWIDEQDDATLMKHVMKRYLWLVNRVAEDDISSVFVLPQLHTLLWGNKRGV